jgi:hypothetical protein
MDVEVERHTASQTYLDFLPGDMPAAWDGECVDVAGLVTVRTNGRLGVDDDRCTDEVRNGVDGALGRRKSFVALNSFAVAPAKRHTLGPASSPAAGPAYLLYQSRTSFCCHMPRSALL